MRITGTLRTAPIALLAAGVLLFDVHSVHASTRTTKVVAAAAPAVAVVEEAPTPATTTTESPVPVVATEAATSTPTTVAVAATTAALTTVAAPTTYAVATRTLTVVRDGRTLPVTVYAPDASGTFPLVVFVHGWNSSPSVYDGLLRAWAAAGYVVAAPTFPETSSANAVDEGDMVNEPADVSAVITTMLTATDVDPGAGVGVAGHSDGAMVALAVGYAEAYRDPRVTAVQVLEGAQDTGTFGSYAAGSAALLVAQSDTDEFNAEQSGLNAYAVDEGGTRALLQLHGVSHLGPYTGTSTAGALVDATTTAWWDLHLAHRTATTAAVVAAGTSAGLAEVQLG